MEICIIPVKLDKSKGKKSKSFKNWYCFLLGHAIEYTQSKAMEGDKRDAFLYFC